MQIYISAKIVDSNTLLLIPFGKGEIRYHAGVLLEKFLDVLEMLINLEEEECLATIEFKLAIDQVTGTKKKAIFLCLHNKEDVEIYGQISKEYDILMLQDMSINEMWLAILIRVNQITGRLCPTN
jgi:hypothetical protein